MRSHPRRVGSALLLAGALLAPCGSAQAQAAGLVRFPIPRDDGSLTPYTFEVGYPLVALVYDTLTLRDANGVPRPLLARSIKRSADERTVTIELRHGVRWQDGAALTAQDVVFSYDYYRTHRHVRFTAQLRDIAGASATGRYSLEIRLSRPSLGFADQPLADVPIIPRHLWANLPAGRAAPPGLPVGSGPYRLVGHDRGRGYRFAANPRYFLGAPAVARIEVPIIDRTDRMLDALTGHRVDAVAVVPQGSAPAQGNGDVRVLRGPSYLGTVLLLDLRRPPFDRPEVRRAISDALDLTRIARAAGGFDATSGVRPADHGYVSPDSPWAPRAVLHRPDPGSARIAFAEQGVTPFGVLAPRDDPLGLEAGRQVVFALQRAGAPARLEAISADELAQRVGERGGAADFDAAIWSAPPLASYDPAFLRAVFGSRGATLNDAGYASASFDRLADRVDDARTAGERRRASDAELGLLARDLPVVPLFYADAGFAYRPTAYGGWVFVRGSGIFDKRSFLPRGGVGRGAGSQTANPADRSGQGDVSLLPFIVGAAALLAVGAAWRVARSGARR